jgi:amino acid transporter
VLLLSGENHDSGVDWDNNPQCTRTNCEVDELELKRTIDWKQGLAISLGVPLLILPSIGYLTGYAWAFSIMIWGLTVLLGFLQNTSYAEMATVFPKSLGMPGYTQTVFSSGNENVGDNSKSISKFLGGFSAWGYWFGWSPTLAIYAILIGTYLHNLLPIFNFMPQTLFNFIIGGIVFGSMVILNSKGLKNGATISYILAVVSLLPLIIISVAPFVTGDFHLANITGAWMPTDWSWDLKHILMLFGLFAMAEWSAVGFESAAIFAPEYKHPNVDTPKALFSCGLVCLVIYVLVQASVIGTLGVKGVLADPISPMLPLAKLSLGPIGGIIAIIILIAAMLLIIQTAFLSSARSIYSMSVEGNLPAMFSKLNENGNPANAMIADSLFNMCLILLGTPTAIISAAAVGYVIANGLSLFAYVKSRKDPKLAKLERPFEAPRGWTYIALITGILNIPFFLIGIIYINALDSGWTATIVGFVVILLYIPIWIILHQKSKTIDQKPVFAD